MSIYNLYHRLTEHNTVRVFIVIGTNNIYIYSLLIGTNIVIEIYIYILLVKHVQGGINAALGNMTEDDWRWHA